MSWLVRTKASGPGNGLSASSMSVLARATPARRCDLVDPGTICQCLAQNSPLIVGLVQLETWQAVRSINILSVATPRTVGCSS